MQPSMPTSKPFNFKLDKQQIILGTLCVLSLGVLVLFLMYRSAKRRADYVIERNDEMHQALTDMGYYETLATPSLPKKDRTRPEDMEAMLSIITKLSKHAYPENDTEYQEVEEEQLTRPKTTVVKINRQQQMKEIDPTEERSAWLDAKKEDTLEAYQAFLDSEYPTARYRGAAAKKIKQLKNTKAQDKA